VRFALDPSPVDRPLLQVQVYPRSPLPPPSFHQQHVMAHRGGRQHPWTLPAPPPALMGSTWGAGAYAPPAPERKTTPARILSSLRPSSAHGHHSSSREHSPTGGRSLSAGPAASVSRARAARPTSWTASAQDAEALAAALAAQKKQRRHSAYGSEQLRPPPSPAPGHGHGRRAVSASTLPTIYTPHHRAASADQRPRSRHSNEPRWCESPTLTPPRSVTTPSPSFDTPNFSRPAAYPAPEPWLHTPSQQQHTRTPSQQRHTPSPPRSGSAHRSYPPSASRSKRLQVHHVLAEPTLAPRRPSMTHDAIVPRSLSAALAPAQPQAYVPPVHAPQRRLSKGTTLPEVVEHPLTPLGASASSRAAVVPLSLATRPSLHSLALASHGHARRSLASSA
jgi:hypothetical protein